MSSELSAPHKAEGKSGSSFVLTVLAASQFLMTLDTSVMNVAIRQVAADVGTTVTGVQTAITLYALVMASFMITGGKIGTIIGRRRAFAIGLAIYGVGSLTTALAPNLGVLIFSRDSVRPSSCRPSSDWWPPTSPKNDGRPPTA